MKILKRGTKSSCKFKVIKNNFMLAGGHKPEVNEVIEFIGEGNLCDALALVRKGALIPDDLPDKAPYICLRDFFLPGRDKKYEARKNDIVELRSKDGLELMLKGIVAPKNKSQWCPFKIREIKKPGFTKGG